MLTNFLNSMERKRVDLTFFNNYFEPKERSPTPQHLWLRKNLSKEILQQILEVLSPNLIAKSLGVHRDTILRLINEYEFFVYDAGHYISIDCLIRYHGNDYEFYKPYHHWLKYLEDIGIFNDH